MTTQPGVYAIVLSGTKIAYVGQAKNPSLRWKQHQRRWIWPNDAEFVVARVMPDSTRSRRQKTESALARLMRRRGFFLISRTTEEHTRLTIPLAVAKIDPEVYRQAYAKQTSDQRAARTAAARATNTHDGQVAAGRKGGAASVAAYSPEQRSNRMKEICESMTEEQLSERGRLGGQASAAVSNKGRFTSERLRGRPLSSEHRNRIRQALLSRRSL